MQHLRSRIKQRLNLAGRKAATKIGVGLTPACQQMMEDMVGKGITRMENQRVLEREAQVRLAEDNLKKLVSELSVQAAEIGTFPVCDDQAFTKAFQRACPIWPYC